MVDVAITTFPVDLTDFDGFEWDIDNTVFGSEFTGISNGTSDAFDGGFRWTDYDPTGSNPVLTDDREVNFGATTLLSNAGLTGSRSIYVSDTKGYARFLDTISNTTNANITYTYTLYTNLGSDSSTSVISTGNGNTTFEINDTHITTDDSADGNGGSDSVVTHVFHDNNLLPSSAVQDVNFSGDLQITYTVTIPAGGSISFLSFGFQNANAADAAAQVTDFQNDFTGYLEGLSGQELSQISNFSFSAATAGDDVILGTDGDDVINGLGGSDKIYGLDGNDTFTIIDTAHIIVGTETVSGGEGTDTLLLAGTSGSSEVYDFQGSTLESLEALEFLQDTTSLTLSNRTASFNSSQLVTGSLSPSLTITADTLQQTTAGNTQYSENHISIVMDSSSLDISGWTFMGWDASDSLTITGSAADETITGSSIDDIINGGDGNDRIDGGVGMDAVSGGGGNDVFVFKATDIDVGNESVQGGDGSDTILLDGLGAAQSYDFHGSTIEGIESLVFYNDTSANDRTLLLTSSHIGANLFSLLLAIDADEAADSINNISITMNSLSLDLSAWAFNTEWDSGDTITINGSLGSEAITGTSVNDTIDGGAGNDTINGGIGDDNITGGEGDDSINGGAGTDTLLMSGNFSDYTVVANNNDTFTITDNVGTDGVDTLANVEFLKYADFTIVLDTSGGGIINLTSNDDTFTASTADEVINALAGDDLIYADDGNDTVNGGAGNDTLNGQNGNDTLTGGEGDDIIRGGSGMDTLVLIGNFTDYTIIDNGNGSFAITHINDGSDGIDTVVSIEFIQYADGTVAFNSPVSGTVIDLTNGDDVFTATATGQVINALDGNDLVNAGGGDDEVNGGDGNDNLRGDAGADTLNGGLGADILRGGAGADVLNGGAGTDVADYTTSGGAIGVTVNLATNVNTGGDAEGDTLFFIDRVNGSSRADNITGNDNVNYLRGFAQDDVLIGGAGNDYLQGDAGADTLDGGAGINDWVYYFSSTVGLTVNLSDATQNTEEAIGDSYTGIENLLGSQHDDNLTGDSGNNFIRGVQGDDMLYGGDGNDFLRGDQGADLHDGGAGVDWAYYATSSSAVTIDLAAGTASGGDAAGDTFLSIERIYGSSFADSITGNDAANYLRGSSGDDTLSGGESNDFLQGDSGADALDGGTGSDWAYYASATTDLVIDLSDTTNNTGEAIGDSYTSIENVVGGRFNDTITGDSGNNTLRGFHGDDTLNGGAGDDILRGEAGADIFVFEAGGGNDAVIDWVDADDMLNLSSFGFADATAAMATAAQVGADVIFTIGSDTITIEDATLVDMANNLIL